MDNNRSIKTWFDINENTLDVWEGVLALQNIHTNDISLFKIHLLSNNEYEIAQMHIDNRENITNITSDGYFSCAEIVGHFNDNYKFYYHCTTPKRGYYLLKYIQTMILHTETIEEVTIRVDLNPERKAITRRTVLRKRNAWKELEILLHVQSFVLTVL
jgi:hypothetical protein